MSSISVQSVYHGYAMPYREAYYIIFAYD